MNLRCASSRALSLLSTGETETFPTIGEFYDAVLDALQDLGSKVPYRDRLDKQLTNGFPSVFVISDFSSAKDAITRIQREGEGTSRFPLVAPDNRTLSHFYKFGEIYFRKAYVFDSTAQTGDWTGSDIVVPPVACTGFR
jgi:hypothetical protein